MEAAGPHLLDDHPDQSKSEDSYSSDEDAVLVPITEVLNEEIQPEVPMTLDENVDLEQPDVPGEDCPRQLDQQDENDENNQEELTCIPPNTTSGCPGHCPIQSDQGSGVPSPTMSSNSENEHRYPVRQRARHPHGMWSMIDWVHQISFVETSTFQG